jgi:small-conductance mechanosensitive channel
MNELILKFQDLINDPIIQIGRKQFVTWEQVIKIFLCIIFAYLIYFIIKSFVDYRVKRKKLRGAQSKALVQLSGYIIFITTLIYLPHILGYSLSYFFVGSTALLVGLGFGLQQLFLDLVSGILLLIDKNINLGDVIKTETLEAYTGKIIHIGLRTTQIQTTDNQIILIPNSKMISSGVKSLMREKGAVRFRIDISVAYKTEMPKAISIIQKALNRDVRVEKSPIPDVTLKEFQSSGVLLEARFWLKELFQSEIILSDLRFEILKEFQLNDIEIPFQQTVVHIQK